MPTYRFQCEKCGLNFTGQKPVDTAFTKCTCGAMAPRVLPKGVNVTVSGGNVDTRTEKVGFSGIDYGFDRAVGESARKNWNGIRGRYRDKLDIIRANDATGWDLSRNPDGTYRVMNPEERAASERSREFHFKMVGHGKSLTEKKPV
jgi:putative FmdB family regulatory protein